MKKHIKLFTIILFSICIIGTNILGVHAGNVTLSFKGNDTVKVNDTITLTVSVSDINGLTNGLATAQGDLIFDETYLEYVSFKSVSEKLSVSYGTRTKRFVALGMGGEFVPNSDNLFNITFKAKQVGTTTLNMKDIVIGDTKAIIHSSNMIEKTINIVADNASVPTPKPTNKVPNKPKNPTPKPTANNKNSNNKLDSLLVNNAKLSPSFSPDTLTYDVVVGKDVNKLDLKYVTSDPKAVVKIEGNSNLKTNEKTTVKIIVTAEDGSTRTYTLNVTKSDESVSNRLILLNVKEGSLENSFDSDTYEYTITVPKNIKKLTIDAIPERKDCKVEILGNKNLGGKNSLILIKLTDKNGYNSYYRLNVKRSASSKLFGIDIRYILLTLIILFILLWLLFLLLFKRKKDEEEEEKPLPLQHFSEEEDPLFDDVVTKEEIIMAIENHDPKLLKMLLTQEEANRLKSEIKSDHTINPYDVNVTKEELVAALDSHDPKLLKMLLTQEKANKLKKEIKSRDE